jgi:transposase
MDRLPETTGKVTTLARAAGMKDPGRVADDARRRPDPGSSPERARRQTFTAEYKLEVLAAYDAAPDGEKGAVLRREGLYSSHITEWRKARDVTALAGLAVPRGRKRRDPAAEQIAGCKPKRIDWSRSWPRPARWWMCRQNCTRSWRRSPRARIPIRSRHDDPSSRHRVDVASGRTGRLPSRGCRTGRLCYRRHRQSPARHDQCRSRTAGGEGRGL